jgi:exodeoxyribonuclease VIII
MTITLDKMNVMVDLETLGTASNSVIISMGAVAFDNEGNTLSTFYRRIDPQSCVDAGLKVDVSTVMWWMKQSDAARAAFNEKGVPLAAALGDFAMWVPEDACLWGNGATFDNVLLASAYKAAGLKTPWPYWGDRCYRTVKALHPTIAPPPFKGEKHNALSDAQHQTEYLLKIAGAAQ